MYNLATVLDENTTVSHALNDSNLKRDMELLEKEYLDASKQNVSDEYTSYYYLYTWLCQAISNYII